MTQKRIQNLLNSLIKLVLHSKKTILLILLVIIATLAISTLILTWLNTSHNTRFPSIGRIITTGVKAYWDANLTNETKDVQWGTIYPGSSTNVIIYLQSASNVETTLHLNTTNWTFKNSNNATVSGPSQTSQYMHLNWSYNDTRIHPNEVIQVTLALFADSSFEFLQFLTDNNVTNFSFDIIITALEH